MQHSQTLAVPGHAIPDSTAPGHWLLARLGKRVLRPGGIETTRRMLDGLAIGPQDKVVELAPGMGHTAERVIARRPAHYIGVDRDPDAVARLRQKLAHDNVMFVDGCAQDTALPGESASVLFGEAMMSMQPERVKRLVVDEAWRILRRGGRYGMHELCLRNCSIEDKKTVERELATAIHHGVMPLSVSEWRELLESAGFTVTAQFEAPMHLLEPRRVIQDEGILRTALIAGRMIAHPEARRRVMQMRSVFRKLGDRIGAISLVAQKLY